MARICSQEGESHSKNSLAQTAGFNSHIISNRKEKVSFPQFQLEEPNKDNALKSTFEYLTSPQEENNAIEEDAYLEKSAQHKNSDFIVSYLNIFHWTLLVPNGIKYDYNRNGFYATNPGLLLKSVSYLWILCLCGYLSIIYFNGLDQPYTVKRTVGQVCWGCYTLFDITAITCLRTNGKEIAKLLTEGNQICNMLGQIISKGANKKRGYLKFIIWIVCGLTLTYTAFFIIFVIAEMTAATTNLYSVYLNLTSPPNYSGDDDDVDKHLELYDPCTSEKQVLCNLIVRSTSSIYASVLLLLWFVMAFSVELIWITYLIMTASWGYYFKRMYMDCTQVIESGQLDLLDGMRIYTKISVILEDYNKIFGNTLLWIVLGSMFYVAVTLGEFLAGFTSGLVFDTINVLGFVPFIAAIFTASELHKTGQILPTIIKKQFLNVNVRDYDQTLQLMQGTSVVQYDTLSNNSGLKGAGFFTISYTFVGSMVGVIITYSLVTVQLKLDEMILN